MGGVEERTFLAPARPRDAATSQADRSRIAILSGDSDLTMTECHGLMRLELLYTSTHGIACHVGIAHAPLRGKEME